MRAFLFARPQWLMFLFRRSTIRVSQLSACLTFARHPDHLSSAMIAVSSDNNRPVCLYCPATSAYHQLELLCRGIKSPTKQLIAVHSRSPWRRDRGYQGAGSYRPYSRNIGQLAARRIFPAIAEFVHSVRQPADPAVSVLGPTVV